MPAAHPVRHLHFGQIQVLRSLAQVLASHGVQDKGGIGYIGRWKPETHVGSYRLFLVGRLGFNLFLPLHEFLQFLLIMFSKVSADGFH